MTSSSGKRVKTLGNKRKDPERSYSNKFLSNKHERHFHIVQDRRLLMERKVGWIPSFAPQFGEEVERRGWEKLVAYPKLANIAVVKEFYTNARPFGNTHTDSYMSYVRGKIIRYDPKTINMFMHAEWDSEHCQFALSMDEGVEFDDVERILCVPGGRFQRNRNDAPVHTNEIQTCASFVNNKAPLAHPSLITHLCEKARVNTLTPPMERPRKEIDASYCSQYFLVDEAAQHVPPPYPTRVHRRMRQPSRCHHHILLEFIGGYYHQQKNNLMMHSLFQMRDMYMSLIIGLYDTPPSWQWTMDEFNIVVGWPKDQAQASGVGATKASAMEDDDEDDDYEDGDEEEADHDEEEDSD
ncbi:hypothetical protein LR48_Vigan10g166500 [Vigna angularis]|uniref:Putative plant transposon protein domain-containing protein n=1 Tax=Phaseolus angularis TaxID=3914 RepID=A0A0L9VLC3_PHAAN|nr:hypothetical protein LR48_Vigan10g166500 [Vigna angularis]